MVLVDYRRYTNKLAFEHALALELDGHHIDWIILAGFMRILSEGFVKHFEGKIINIHPSLLPAFPGLESYARAFKDGCRTTGVTVHLVGSGVDDGPVCAQESFSIAECRSAEDVEKIGLKVEHDLFVKTLNWLVEENYEIEKRDGRLCVRSR